MENKKKKPTIIVDTLKTDAELQVTAKEVSDLLIDYFKDKDIPPRTGAFIAAIAIQSIEIISKVHANEVDPSTFPDGDKTIGIFDFSSNWALIKGFQGKVEHEFAESRKTQ